VGSAAVVPSAWVVVVVVVVVVDIETIVW